MLNCVFGFLLGILGVGFYHVIVVSSYSTLMNKLNQHFETIQTRTNRMVNIMQRMIEGDNTEGIAEEFTEAMSDLSREFGEMSILIIRNSIPGANHGPSD